MDDGPRRLKSVSGLIFAGVATVVGAFGLFFVSTIIGSGAGKVVAVIAVPVGIVLVALGLGSGWGEAFGDSSKKPLQSERDVYIVAKVVADDKGLPVIDPEFFDPAELRYYVRLTTRSGARLELETALPVFEQVGEGMNGDIVFQGRWLNQFTFRPRA